MLSAVPVFTIKKAFATPMTMARGYIRLCIWPGRTKTAAPEITQSIAPMVRSDFRRRLFHLISYIVTVAKTCEKIETFDVENLEQGVTTRVGPPAEQRTPGSCSRI